jgi:single-stranded DNA-binding protein
MGHPLSRAGAAHLESGQAFRHRDTQSDGENSQFWSLVAFPETAQSELLRLNAGDSVSVHGALKAETYKKTGVTIISLSVVVDSVLPLRAPTKPRSEPEHRALDTSSSQATSCFDDAAPF